MKPVQGFTPYVLTVIGFFTWFLCLLSFNSKKNLLI